MDTFSRLILTALAALLFLAVLPVRAASIRAGSGPSVTYSGSGASVNYTNDFADLLGRAIKNDVPTNEYASALNRAGGVKVTDSIAVNTSRGAISARATTAVSARAIARGAASAARALPYVGGAIIVGQAAYEIYDLLNDNRIRPYGNGDLRYDPGVPESEYEGWCWQGRPRSTRCFLDYLPAISDNVAYQNECGSNCSVTFGAIVEASENSVTYTRIRVTVHTDGTVTTVTEGASVSRNFRVGKRCPPAPVSTGSVDRDGMCPTGKYTKPLSNDEATDILEKDVKEKNDKVPLVQDILATPGGAIDIAPGATTTSGPSTQTGPAPAPVVSNGPAGQTTTSESPGIAIRYRGNQIEWEPEQVTTRRPNPNGGPDIEETTDAPDEPSADPNSTAVKVEIPDYCLDHPKRAGCSELGDVEPPEWNPDEKPIELRAESPWGGDNASCPPPRTITLGGRQYQWEWTLVCQFFSGIRFAVLTVAWVSAVMIFLGARNES